VSAALGVALPARLYRPDERAGEITLAAEHADVETDPR
jgi:hypothetical protein